MFRRHFELYLTMVLAVALAAFLKYPPPPMSSEVLSWNNTGHYTDHNGYSIFYKGNYKQSVHFGRQVFI